MDHMMMSNSTSNGNNDFCVGAGRVMLPGFQLAADGGSCVLFLFKDAVVDTKTKYVNAICTL
jgi:hypothetical protein